MKKLEHLDLFSFRIIGEQKQVLLDSLIALYNEYVKAYQSKDIKWYGGMRFSINDGCFITGWGHSKVEKTLKSLCNGIKHNNKTFKPVEEKSKNGKKIHGYFSINVDELDRLCNYIENYKSEWKRDNEKWIAENKADEFGIDEALKIMASQNYELLYKKYRNNKKG